MCSVVRVPDTVPTPFVLGNVNIRIGNIESPGTECQLNSVGVSKSQDWSHKKQRNEHSPS